MVKIIFLLLLPVSTFCQSVFSRNRQHEAGAFLGSMHALTDVQGTRGIGRGFLKDLNPENGSISAGIFYTYYPDMLDSKLAIKVSMMRGVMHAADSLIEDKGGDELARKKRNLSFRTTLYEFYLSGEYFLTLGRLRPSLSAGLGMIKFTPTTVADGKVVKLRPLMTEDVPYPTMQVIIPVGAGLKYYTDRHKVFSFEVVHRFTFTDYLDDVSTVYSGNPLSFREKVPRSDYGGEQRGDPSDRDGYFTLVLKYSMLLKQDVRFLRKQSLKCPTIY